MKKAAQAIRHANKPNPIPESVWDQIKSPGNKEPWREATMVALRGHAKKQGHKLTREYNANKP